MIVIKRSFYRLEKYKSIELILTLHMYVYSDIFLYRLYYAVNYHILLKILYQDLKSRTFQSNLDHSLPPFFIHIIIQSRKMQESG